MKYFLLKNFNKNLLHLHNTKCILIENLAMHSRYPNKSLESECKSFYQKFFWANNHGLNLYNMHHFHTDISQASKF